MKLSNLLLFTGAAAASFCLVKNREKLMNEAVESYELMDRIQDNLQNIQRNLQAVQEQKDNLQTISQDLTSRHLEHSHQLRNKKEFRHTLNSFLSCHCPY